jgi:hypothetical protein
MQFAGGEFAVYFGAPATSANDQEPRRRGPRGRTDLRAHRNWRWRHIVGRARPGQGAGNMVESVQLNSPGGRLAEGAKLAAVIKTAKLATYVSVGEVCASACFLAFAAGTSKVAGPTNGRSKKDDVRESW